MNKGFTLIELLVVVLIIGILAAVALPQYQKAVAKSKMAAVKPLLKSVKDAEEIYFESHGEYTSDLTELDVQVPEDASYIYVWSDNDSSVVGADLFDVTGGGYEIYLANSARQPGSFYCWASEDSIADAVCKSEGTLDEALTDYYGSNNYLISGTAYSAPHDPCDDLPPKSGCGCWIGEYMC